MSQQKLMIVDDEEVLCHSLRIDLEDDGYEVGVFHDGESAVAALAEVNPGVVLLDLRLPRMDGIAVLKRIREFDEEIKTIMMTAYGDTQKTVETVKNGAYDFINKPFELDELKAIIKNAFESRSLKREVTYLRYKQEKFKKYFDLVGKSEKMLDIYRQIDIIAQTRDTTVLILGESGTGKELVAEAIHHKSERSKESFMEINCASLPENLLESELFGYEKGAFTDAKEAKKGLFELADGGTVFLDEVGELPVATQAKLLRFLEKKSFKRLGSGKELKVDVRVVAATNRDLNRAIANKQFRNDLYYRLNVVSLFLPPLRDRQDDILLLANYFLDSFCREMGKPSLKLTDEVAAIFENYPWNGNVRELRNVVERIVIFADSGRVGTDLLPGEMLQSAPSLASGPVGDTGLQDNNLDQTLARVEREIIRKTLAEAGGNKTKTAELLGISRFSLGRRIDRLSVEN
ncbi:sigma-54-dependent transcriptional regulator [Desulforhopalus singaporensis]|uniref:Two-component system, NtrC family, response regulator AtoC n=1 Tax=Desulforhopalus singaporensis TaxID=91360 RepID=A0A1H0QDD5_9BACT|nr:sigma-54 dependent transcriptional regulator [Desulforhopalus singaporensis]SDP15347.1 two-component system, NtrC family, response regulator AtoC [Desulforhopalus singaporensis]